MNRNLAIVLSIFAIGYFGFLIIASTNVFAEVPVNYEYIFAEETVGISDKIKVSLNGVDFNG